MLNISINLSTISITFLIIHFLECFLIIYTCEEKYSNALITEKIINKTDCQQTYSSLTVKYLIDLFNESQPFTWILNNILHIHLCLFVLIVFYGIMKPTSGAGTTFRGVFQVLHQDLKDSTTEIWQSIRPPLNQIFECVTIVKLLELIVIGTFIVAVPDIVNFFMKILMKIGKI